MHTSSCSIQPCLHVRVKLALFNVTKCARDFDPPVASGGKTRKYFIAAEEKMWNYGPSGINKMTGEGLLKPGR